MLRRMKQQQASSSSEAQAGPSKAAPTEASEETSEQASEQASKQPAYQGPQITFDDYERLMKRLEQEKDWD